MQHWRRFAAASSMAVFYLAAVSEIAASTSVQRRTEDAAYPFDLSEFSIRFGSAVSSKHMMTKLQRMKTRNHRSRSSTLSFTACALAMNAALAAASMVTM